MFLHIFQQPKTRLRLSGQPDFVGFCWACTVPDFLAEDAKAACLEQGHMEACSKGNNGCYSQIRKRGKLDYQETFINFEIQAVSSFQFKWAAHKCDSARLKRRRTLLTPQNDANLIQQTLDGNLFVTAAVIHARRQTAISTLSMRLSGTQLSTTT